MGKWLDMLRASYNWYLRDRIDGYEQQFRCGDYCDVKTAVEIHPLTCSIIKGTLLDNPWKDNGGVNKKGKKVSPKKSVSDMQITSLPGLKDVRPWYQDVYSQVLQQNIKRLDDAFDLRGRGRGRGRGKKGIGNREELPMTSFHMTNTCGIRAESLLHTPQAVYKLNPSPSPSPFPSSVHCSDGSDVDNPRFGTNKKTCHLLKIRQRRVNRKRKGSKNRAKAGKRVAKLHQKIADRRSAYQWQVANKIVKKADCIVVEDLNIKGMKTRCKPKQDEKGRFLPNGQAAKRGLNRAISDAAWGDLISKIEYTAAKQGKVLVKVNPRHTSQTCSACGHVDKSSRDREKFICTNCGQRGRGTGRGRGEEVEINSSWRGRSYALREFASYSSYLSLSLSLSLFGTAGLVETSHGANSIDSLGNAFGVLRFAEA